MMDNRQIAHRGKAGARKNVAEKEAPKKEHAIRKKGVKEKEQEEDAVKHNKIFYERN